MSDITVFALVLLAAVVAVLASTILHLLRRTSACETKLQVLAVKARATEPANLRRALDDLAAAVAEGDAKRYKFEQTIYGRLGAALRKGPPYDVAIPDPPRDDRTRDFVNGEDLDPELAATLRLQQAPSAGP